MASSFQAGEVPQGLQCRGQSQSRCFEFYQIHMALANSLSKVLKGANHIDITAASSVYV